MLIFLEVFYVLSLLCICRSTPQHLKDLLCLLLPIMHSDSHFHMQSISNLLPMKGCADDSGCAIFCKNTIISKRRLPTTNLHYAASSALMHSRTLVTSSRVVLKFKCMPQNTCVTYVDLTHFLTVEMEINNFHTFWCLFYV